MIVARPPVMSPARKRLAAVIGVASFFLTSIADRSWADDLSKDYTDTPLADLGVELVPEKKDPATGFVVAGKNATALIKKLPKIAGHRSPI